MKRRLFIALSLAVFTVCMITVSAFALDESEVETAVAASSAQEVTGHIFIWFLVAIAFLRISQKIDSFLSSLGLNVGRGGGSMLGELLIAGRAIGMAAKSTGSVISSVFSRGGGQSATAGRAAGDSSFAGGVIGMANKTASKAATGSSSGIRSTIGNAVFASSVKNNGTLAAGIVSTVARGNVTTLGTISGPRAAQALSNYLGYGTDPAESAIDGVSGMYHDTAATSDGVAAACAASNYSKGSVPSEPPTFRDVDIGGGRITGYETAPGGVERQFAMYSTSQYVEPTGAYETVETVDGESWYRQYAEPTVQKMPVEGENGQIRYEERIVQQLPEIPQRKDGV